MTGLAKLRGMGVSFVARASVRRLALLLIAATIVATAVHNYRAIDSQLTAVTLERRQAVAQLMAVTLVEKFGRLVDIAISLATRPRVQEFVAAGKWTEAGVALRAVPQDLPQIEWLFLTDVAGTLKAGVPELPGVRGTNFAYREWFQGVSRDWRPYVSPIYTRTAPPRLRVVAVAVPVKSAIGGVVGILVLQVRIDNLFDRIEVTGLEPGGFVYIVDSKGQAAFHSKRGIQDGIVDLSATPVLEKLQREGRGMEIVFNPVEREDAIVAYTAVPGYGWGVVAQQPVRASLGLAARDGQLRRLLTGYGLILLLGAAAMFLAERTVMARKMAEENRRMKTEFEHGVVERTEELARTNDTLRNEIAEREQAERKFRGLLESAPDAIVVADRNGRIVLVNVQTERLFNYDRDELIGQPVEILIPERFRTQHAGHRTGYVEAPRIRPMGLVLDLYGRRKDGSEFPTAISLSPVGTGDGLVIFTDIRDVTEQRRIEQRVKELNEHLARRNVELEALNKELESFSYSVSHDLRAPLRSIDGFSQALIEDCADKLDERGQSHLARVRAASQRMAELIDDLLQLSRVTRQEMRHEKVDLSALVREILCGFQRSQPERPVETRIGTGLTAHGDPHLLRILLENLLSNAWKFTGTNPHSLIEFGIQRGNDGQPVFYVRDNGVGFDMAYADKLFGAFQRLHASSEFPGTGIGLATTQRIVNRHGGRVWAEAKAGAGATFYFTL